MAAVLTYRRGGVAKASSGRDGWRIISLRNIGWRKWLRPFGWPAVIPVIRDIGYDVAV